MNSIDKNVKSIIYCKNEKLSRCLRWIFICILIFKVKMLELHLCIKFYVFFKFCYFDHHVEKFRFLCQMYSKSNLYNMLWKRPSKLTLMIHFKYMMKMTCASSNLRRVIFYGWNKAAEKVYTKTKKLRGNVNNCSLCYWICLWTWCCIVKKPIKNWRQP